MESRIQTFEVEEIHQGRKLPVRKETELLLPATLAIAASDIAQSLPKDVVLSLPKERRPGTKPVKSKGRGLWLLGMLAVAGLGVAAGLLSRKRGNQHPQQTELKTVHGLHLVRLAGDWYEIARMPGHLSREAVGLRVTFEIQDPRQLNVSYRWHEGNFTAPEQTEIRHLRVDDLQQPAKLKKQLMENLEFDYWIIEAGGHYDYLVIGTPSRQHLWILSRHPQMSESAYQAIVKRMQQQGFDTERLMRVPQPQPGTVATPESAANQEAI